MNNISLNIQTKQYSTYLTLGGSLTSSEAIDFRAILGNYSHSGKDLYIDLKDLQEIDVTGLSALLTANYFVNHHGGQLIIFANQSNPLLTLLTNIKFANQLNFRDCIISDPIVSIAS